MSNQGNVNQDAQSAKVLQLGFNISVSGDPDTDFQIVLDDKGQGVVQSLSQNDSQPLPSSDHCQDTANTKLKHEVEKTKILHQKHRPSESTGAIRKQDTQLKTLTSSEAPNINETQISDSTARHDLNILNEIKSTMEHFEKFSDHLKEIPRLKGYPVATSTPYPNKQNSKSEKTLMCSEVRPRKFAPLYDYPTRTDYYRGSMKPLHPDLFLKPLPGEDYYRKGIVARYFDIEPYRHYRLYDNFSKPTEYKTSFSSKSKSDMEKYEPENLVSEVPPGILKKTDSDNGDKQSTSSADSVKDIKIYQSGGILIMQNFKDNLEAMEKRDISDFSAKLIENCNKLKEEITSGLPNVEEKVFIGNSSDDGKNSGKIVQFDLSGCENQKSKSSDSLSNAPKDDLSCLRFGSSESPSDCLKNKDSSPQGTSHSQDFPSLSTQENDSTVSNHPGTSPPFGASGKKLEWDSGADVGYLNLDLSKENLSTIERIVLKGLSSDGLSEKKVVYEKKPEQVHPSQSKFILERMPSELVIEEIVEASKKFENKKQVASSSESKKKCRELKNSNNKGSEKSVEFHQEHPDKKQEIGELLSKKVSKDQNESKPKELHPLLSVKEKVAKETDQNKESLIDVIPKKAEAVDKSINVNTLFKDGSSQGSLSSGPRGEVKESPSKLKATRLSPKSKKLKKKRISGQRTHLFAPVKDKIQSIIDIARSTDKIFEGKTAEMGIPKRGHRKLEANPEFKEVELSRETEEIIIDQRFKTEQNKCEREVRKGSVAVRPNDSVCNESKKEMKGKNRPISASSSSNNTVLPISENKEEVENRKTSPSEPAKFTDQIIQTNEFKFESVGIQAFASLSKSSVSDEKSLRHSKKMEAPKVLKAEKDETTVSSKNIQAFGLNSSLPKELTHPKETKFIETQNTKSTQFFGGPLNSLPNYHANLVTKPAESCGRMQNVLKTKKNVETEFIRLKEENKKNIMANDESAKNIQKDFKRGNNIENKENLIKEKSAKRNHGNSIRKDSKGIDSENNAVSHESNTKGKESEVSDVGTKKKSEKEATSPEGSDEFRSLDDISNKVLTSEVLREHGDCIDRNIIQEKYFQSQLIEIEKRGMISKSTSIERQLDQQADGDNKNTVTVGCQYSPQSKENTIERGWKTQECGRGDECRKSQRREASEQYDSSQNLMEEERFGTLKSTSQGQDFGTGDSLPSSTQTAHSWVPGNQESGQTSKNGVGRARSFEYLPGHIYESSGNLREELPSETEQNLISGSSSGSSASNAGNNLACDGLKDSEGRNTLILENSKETSDDSNRMKILDENLTLLNSVVSKLREKDAQIQSITQSLLVNYWKKNGSGDSFDTIDARDAAETCKIDVKDNAESSGAGKESGSASSNKRILRLKKRTRDKDMSIACQTEGKSSTSVVAENFYEGRKALERRINEEKESQIKWIENEIHHLNILRGLLEKQNFPGSGKEDCLEQYVGPKSEEKYSKNILAEVYSRPVTPAYGCRISLVEAKSVEDSTPMFEAGMSGGDTGDKEKLQSASDAGKFGMAVSLSGGVKSLRRVVMLPVGVQVTLKDSPFTEQCGDDESSDGENIGKNRSYHLPSPKSCVEDNTGVVKQYSQHRQQQSRSDMTTQYPSVTRTYKNSSVRAQTDSSPLSRCSLCQQENCVCLKFSEKSNETGSLQSSCGHKVSEGRGSLGQNFLDNEGRINVNEGHGTSRNSPCPEIYSDSRTNQKGTVNNADRISEDCRSRPRSNSTCADVADIYPVTNQGSSGKSRGNKSESNGSSGKSKTTPSSQCKCEKCSKRDASKAGRKIIVCRNPCQSKVYTNEKPPEEYGSCRCSKVQVEKYSNCACHIIKIHGPKCCSSENGSCSCKRRTALKRTENQFCQTETVTVVEKEMVRTAELVQPTKGPRVVYPSEGKTAVEIKKPVEEKLGLKQTVACEKRRPSVSKLRTQEKIAQEKIIEKKVVSKTERASSPTPPSPLTSCNCHKKKSQEDNHPRHYFLKIEEKEIDESNESVEQRKSVEVITVTIPVKKKGKTKQGTNKNQQSQHSKQSRKAELNEFSNNDCKCCEDCVGRRFQNATRQQDPHMNDDGQNYRNSSDCNCCEDCIGRKFQYATRQHDFYVNDDGQDYQNTSGKKSYEDCIGQQFQKSTRQQDPRVNDDGQNYRNGSNCNCCEDCVGRKFQNATRQHDFYINENGQNYQNTSGKKSYEDCVGREFPKSTRQHDPRISDVGQNYQNTSGKKSYEDCVGREFQKSTRQQDPHANDDGQTYWNATDCKCCEDCIGRRFQNATRQQDPHTNDVGQIYRNTSYCKSCENCVGRGFQKAAPQQDPHKNDDGQNYRNASDKKSYEDCRERGFQKAAQQQDPHTNDVGQNYRNTNDCKSRENCRERGLQKVAQQHDPHTNDVGQNYQNANDCKNCENCRERGYQKAAQQHVSLTNDGGQNIRLEKPEPQQGALKQNYRASESSSCGKVIDYQGTENFCDELLNRQSSSSQQFFRRKDTAEYLRFEAEYFNQRRGTDETYPMEDCSSSKRILNEVPSRDIQSDYDSHKEFGRKQNVQNVLFSSGSVRFEKEGRKNERFEQPEQRGNWSSKATGANNVDNSGYPRSQEYIPDRNNRESDYYNYDKREYMTKSELQRESEKKQKNYQPSLQECLVSNRPDFYSNAENRRQIIAERSKERVNKHNNRLECVMNLIHQCNEREPIKNGNNAGPKRIFTTSQMREQTMKRYRQLPEVTEKLADQKKKAEYQTNKLMADVFAKKLQQETLKGHINLSNSVSVLSTI